MDAKDRVEELMRLPLPEIRTLPERFTQDALDEEGRKCQLVTWREQVGPDSWRIVVSQHRLHGLGISSLHSVSGFVVDSSGMIKMLDPAEAERLFL